MQLQKLVPMLYTNDLKGTIDFYVQTLGFTCASYNIDWGWASLILNNVEIMLSLPNEHLPFEKPSFTGSFYFTVTDVDNLWNKLKDESKIGYPLESFEYGMREFAIYDNNGYFLQFGQCVSPNNSD